jgi:hypothetical protein
MPDSLIPDSLIVEFDRNRSGRQLRLAADPDLEDDEVPVAWTRAWVSREGKYNVLLAARHRDFVMVSSGRLLLFSCGFFTRRPKRMVFNARRELLEVDDIGRRPGRRLRVTGFRKKALRFDFGHDAASRDVVGTLLGAEPVAAKDAPEVA